MKKYLLMFSLVVMVLAVFFGLLVPSLSLNYEALLEFTSLDALVFWIPALFLILSITRAAVKQTISKIKTITGATIFFGYLAIHYFVYSLVLEKIISSLYSSYLPISTPSIFLSATPFSGLLAPIFSLTLNPFLVLLLPPYFELDLSPFAIIIGLVIAFYVTASLTKIMEIRGKLPAYYLSIPVGGVVTGASCCISLPFLIADFTPLSSAVLLSPVSGIVLLIAYYMLPISTAVALGTHVTLLFRTVSRKPTKYVSNSKDLRLN